MIGGVAITEELSAEKDKPKDTLRRLGLAALGGIIGALIGFNIDSGTGLPIPEILWDGFITIFLLPVVLLLLRWGGFIAIFLLPVLLSLPAALIKHRAISLAVSLLVGALVSFGISSIMDAIVLCGMGGC